MKDEMTLKQASELTGIQAKSLWAAVKRGRLKAEKRGRDWFVNGDDLLNYIGSKWVRVPKD